MPAKLAAILVILLTLTLPISPAWAIVKGREPTPADRQFDAVSGHLLPEQVDHDQ